MTDHVVESPSRGWARVAGLGYLIIIVAGITAEFLIRSRLIVPGDAAATASAIAGAQRLFRLGIAGDLVMLGSDVLVAAALYAIFRPVSRNLALLAACFRLVHAAVVAASLLTLYLPLAVLDDSLFAAFGPAQRHALVALSLDLHDAGYAVGLVFFGFHCLVLGALVIRSGYVPKLLGVLLVVAAFGYLTDSFGRTVLTNYLDYEAVLGAVVFGPAVVAELSFSLWLLVKGVRGGRVPVTGLAR